MRFEKGDRVKFLNDIGGGVITSIDRKIAHVLNADGFEIPMPIHELILIEAASLKLETNESAGKAIRGMEKSSPAIKRVNENQVDALPEEPEKIPDSGKNPVFSLHHAIVPAKDISSGKEIYDLYLINDSEFNLLFNFGRIDDRFFRSLQSGFLEADTKLYVISLSREELNAFPVFRIQAIFHRRSSHVSHSPLNRDFHVDPQELFSTSGFIENDFFDEKAYVRPVREEKHWSESVHFEDESIRRLIHAKESGTQLPKEEKLTVPDVEEVDLHIHELVETHAGLSNAEIIEIQMARFHTALEGALRSKVKRIVLIHGVGNGKLKFEIRKELDRKYPRLRYQDASYQEYGYGATLVILRK